MSKNPPKLNFLNRPLNTLDDVRENCKEIATGCYVMAALQGILGYFLIGPFALIDASIWAVLGFLIHKFYSRIASIILFFFSGYNCFLTLQNMFTKNPQGGRNIALAILTLLMSVQAIRSTFRYHQLNKQK